MYKELLFIICFLTILFSSCNNRIPQSASNLVYTNVDLVQINVNPTETDASAQGIIELDSYIVLSNEEMIGQVSRILISNDFIYILDNTPKVLCYDMTGKLMFQIKNRGSGPQEYGNLIDISIDNNGYLIAYDSAKRKLFFYDSKSGKYQFEKPLQFMALRRIVAVNEHFFFDNPDHFNYPQDREKHFYLMYSENGQQIDKTFLPHDAIADYDFGMAGGHPFFYCDDRVLYNKPFDNWVYILEQDTIIPYLSINLPNMLPMKRIEEKMDAYDLITSDYSSCLDNIFIADGVVHFSFMKDGFWQTAFYNLEKNSLLFCGVRVCAKSTPELPFYSIIRGVYNGKFYSEVTARQILERKEEAPECIPDDLINILEEDNQVIAFYRIVKEKN